MITVYDGKTKKGCFSNNGLGVLKDVQECKITEELNGDYSLQLKYGSESNNIQYLRLWNILKADGQLFRIYNIKRVQKGMHYIEVNARHIFYDMSFFFIENAKENNNDIKSAILSSFPKEVIELFDFEIDAELKNIFPYDISKVNCVKALFYLVNIYGYEIKRDNFKIKISEKVGNPNGITLRYGKNVVGIEAIEDNTDLVTSIYPIGKSGLTLKEKYVSIDEEVENLPYPIIKKVEFLDIDDLGDLKNEAKAYLENYSKPKVSMKIDFLTLYKSVEYKEYENLTSASIGDVIEAIHYKLRIKSKIRVIRIEKDIVNPKDISIEVGEQKQTILDEIDKSDLINQLKKLTEENNNVTTIYKKNSSDITFNITVSQIVFEFETFISDNINFSLNIAGEASEDMVLDIIFEVDGVEIPFKPKQRVGKGNNVISIQYVLLQQKKGAHVLKLLIKSSNGNFNVLKGQLILILQGKALAGGISADCPNPYITDNISADFANVYLKNLYNKDSCTIRYVTDLVTDSFTEKFTDDFEKVFKSVTDFCNVSFNSVK